MNNFLLGALIFMAGLLFVVLYRVVKGPERGDRLIAVNVVGTKTLVILAMVALLFHEGFFLDVVLVYALINFVASLFIARELDEEEGKNL